MPRNTTLYKISGTITFRLASAKTIDGKGTNLQNIEKSMRKIYIPDEGKIFCQVDQSGAEALIVAYLCRDGQFRSLFLNGVKPHVFVALHLFADKWQEHLKYDGIDTKVDIDELCKTPIPELKFHPQWKMVDKLIKSSDNWPASQRYYYIAKQVCHSSNYGIKASAFQLNTLDKSKGKIALTKKQAETYLSFYHELFPELRAWHREVENQLYACRTLYNLQGFPRYFSCVIDERMLKEAYAFIPQSTVGTITNTAYTNLQNFIEKSGLKWDLLANTHDSYLVQCPVGEEGQCVSMMKEFINQKLTSPRGEPFNMKSEAAVGFNWAPAKESNPNGLKEL
jgi:DNA polymerase I-like protein with 3'-5' exonuclease and polymerase domains